MSWHEPPNHINFSNPGWWWHAGKVGHRVRDLFGCLHDRHNTAPMFISQPEAFRLDVIECVREADGKDDFHRLLQARRDQRLDQLHHFIRNDLPDSLGGGAYPTMDIDQRFALIRFRRNASLDQLVMLLDSFVSEYGPGLPRRLRKFKVDHAAGLERIDLGALHVPTPSPELRAELAHGFVDLEAEECAEQAAKDHSTNQDQYDLSKIGSRDAGTQTSPESLTQGEDSHPTISSGETSLTSPKGTLTVKRTPRKKPVGGKWSIRVTKGTTNKPTRRSVRQRAKLAAGSQALA